jgi:hypothetical protein
MVDNFTVAAYKFKTKVNNSIAILGNFVAAIDNFATAVGSFMKRSVTLL